MFNLREEVEVSVKEHYVFYPALVDSQFFSVEQTKIFELLILLIKGDN